MNCVKVKKIFCFILFVIILFNQFKIMIFSSKEVYRSASEHSKKIALTFDDGPHPKLTDKILDVLEKYNIKATFFVIGNNVDLYSKPLKRAVEAGHEIGNHTNSHILLEKLNNESIKAEINQCYKKVYSTTGYSMNLLRPPCGKTNDQVINIAKELGYKTILWNVDTHDWSHATMKEIVDNINKNVIGGDIILFHDYISGSQNTVGALDVIIPMLHEKGYEFVTISELIK